MKKNFSKSNSATDSREFFEKMFADGVPENEMPTKPRRPEILPPPDANIARDLPDAEFEILFAAAALTLAKYCGSEDVVIGAVFGENTLPVRVKAPANMAAGDFFADAAAALSDAEPHAAAIVNAPIPAMAVSRAPATGKPVEIFVEFQGKRAVFNYSRELYDDEVIANMAEQFLEILANFAANPSAPICETAELPAAQKKQILEEFAGEKFDENVNETLVSLFRAQAKKTPANRAVKFMEKAVTYAEMDEISDKIAAFLSAKDAGGAVGILVRRSELMPICAMGVMKSGAAYLPIDPSYPAERLEFMLQDAGAKIVIADEDLVERIPNYGGEFLLSKNIAALPAGEIPTAPKPDDTMILLYTSGTTGKPKGVMLSQKNLVSFCTWYTKYQNLSDTDNTAAYASFGFDANMLDMYPTLVSGACIHVIPEEMRLDLPAMREFFDENHISVAFITTQLGRQFAETMTAKNLRALATGGETLVPVAPPNGYDLYNVYGPTECTVFITYFRVDKLYDRVPIGRALGNTALYVVDKQNRLAPVGVAGELCVAGRQVSKGYLNRPDITEEKFIKNPFSDDAEYSRMYRTGDITRFLPDGAIDFVGRSDFQVKIRGFRVELTEIEERIRAHEAVKDAAVIPADAPGGGKCAVAYIVGDAKIDIEELNQFIEAELPPYMVPAATMQIEKIPLNPNGKVDRRKLPAPEFTDNSAESEVRPLNDLEAKIFAVAAEVLGHEQFGLTTNLLRAGLTSLSSIKFAAEIDTKIGVAPNVREIMKNPTLLGVENLILEKIFSQKNSREIKSETRADYPLSQSQMGVYLDCMKNPATTQYNLPFLFSLGAGADAEKLRDAVCKVIDAHPAVKARIAQTDAGVVQIPDYTPATVAVEEISETELVARREKFMRPFDLAKGNLYRAAVLKTPERVAILGDFHHIIFDGTSMDLFLREVCAVYDGANPTPEKLNAFDAALEESRRENSAEWLEDKAHFESQLAEFESASEIAQDIGIDGNSRGVLREVVKIAPRGLAENFCKKHGVTPAALFLAATSYAVGRWTSQETTYLSGISSGRGDPRVANTAGMFVRTLPLVIRRDGAASCLDFVRSAGATLSDAVAHEGYAYTNIARDFGYAPSIMFTCQLGLLAEYRAGGGAARLELLDLTTPKFKLSVHIEERGGDFVFAVQYNDALYSGALIERFAETLALALENIMEETDAPIAKISLLSNAQREIIKKFNETGGGNAEATLHGMFEAAAEKNPSHTALIAEDATYTFAELNAAANRLAHGLIQNGTQKGDFIAFSLRRTGRIPIAMLGIMKAGCAYIPLDPEYPQERVAHVLSDSGAKRLLTADDIDAFCENQSDANPHIAVSPGDLAYLIYTSGSTGKPKGVMLTHRGISNYVDPAPQNIHVHALVNDATKMMSITTVTFDMFLKESMTALCNGLTLVFAGEDTARDPARLAELFAETGADAFNTTPSVMTEYTAHPALLAAIQKCKIIMCGAEKYPDALLKRLRSGAARLFNTYGPTEITVSCNAKELTNALGVTVGAPLLNVTAAIADADGNELPVGMTGELIIGGRGVAEGYVNLPDMTAEKFVERDGKRVFKTGDVARWTPGGEIEILGRGDRQVKLRGLRIELGEIENALGAVTGISSCAVVIRTILGAEHLCAYYVAAAEIPAAEIKDALRRTLPAYMLPTAYLQLESMPKSPNGKTDTRALPAPALLGGGDYTPPQNETEKKLCEIFAEILCAERVGATDNFFEAGGTSLAVTRIVIAAEAAGISGANGERLSYSGVFANPTPRALAQLISGGCEKGGTETAAEADNYDYTKINALLAENNLAEFRRGGAKKLRKVLLTGATGFLGIHMLDALLKSGATVFCLVRKGKQASAEKRLHALMFYYFEDAGDYGDRLQIIEGDMTDEKCLALAAGVDTVINCAANVTHFVKDAKAFDVNTGGVVNLINFCRENAARLIHISTASVAGFSVGGVPGANTVMDETMLFFGQNLENRYVYSKFLAERAVLEAAAEGLDAKIMRVGNLMARNKDGEFQVNAKANSFLGRLRAYHAIGCFPYSAYNTETELAPIDSTTDAVLRLAATPNSNRVFHPYNNHNLFVGDIILAMNELGVKIDFVEDDVFDAALSNAMKDPSRAEKLTSLVAYQNMAQGKAAFSVKTKNDFTTQALLRLNWAWPETDRNYLKKFILGLIGLGFFE